MAAGWKKIVEEKHRDQVLLSTAILEEIFKHLDLPRLRSSRLTCKLWNQEISRVLSRSSHVNLFVIQRWGRQDELLGSKFRSTFESRDPDVPYPFRDLSFNPLNMSVEDSTWLFTNFRVTELVIRKDRGLLTPEMGKHAMSVIQGCSRTLRKLECPYLGDWDAEDDDESSLRGGKLEFPLLEELAPSSLKYDQWPSPPSAQQQVDFFSKIISTSPTPMGLNLIAYEHLRLLLERTSLVRVQKLHIYPHSPFDPEIWDVLDRRGVRGLTFLRLTTFSYELSPARLGELISLFTGSLQRLSITYKIANCPVCPALTHLEVHTLDVGALDWSKFPNVRRLKCRTICILDLNRNNFVSCLSVRKLSYRGSRPHLWNSGDESMDESLRLEATFSKLFQWFPNATAWKVHHKDVIPFCKAVRGRQQNVVRRFSLILDERECNGDRDLMHVIDRYMFSLLPYLDGTRKQLLLLTFLIYPRVAEMEELVLENCTPPGMEMKLAEIDFSKLLKLKCLKVYNYDPPEEECAVLGRIPKVLMVSSGSAKWSRPITSMPNVEFRQVLSRGRKM